MDLSHHDASVEGILIPEPLSNIERDPCVTIR